TPTISVQGPGEYGYPAQERIGPTWWPRDPVHEFACKVDSCQLQNKDGCRCDRPYHRSVAEIICRFLGVWQVWKATRKRLLKSLRLYRRSVDSNIYPCLELITVDEVVALALRQLRRPRTAHRRAAQGAS